jgi:hypothetical protein
MELYSTKKISSVEEFGLAPLDTLPSMHIITPDVIVKVDIHDNMYIADCPNDSAGISNLIKIKKLLCKQQMLKNEDSEKVKMMDDIIWIKPAPNMLYKSGKTVIPMNRMLLNRPIKLQLSCKNNYIYNITKPYNVYNMFWSIDYVILEDSFDWNTLNQSSA